MRFAIFCLAATCFAADITGPWELSITGGQASFGQHIDIAQKDGKYSFSFQGDDAAVALDGQTVRITVVEDGKQIGDLSGRLTDQGMSGDGKIEGLAMTWSARRPAQPPAAPQRHEFTPTVFYREFSGAKPPALRIFPGDTVHTTTVDAGGRDASETHRVFGGNPLTGPFYVEGAMPGDTLAVTFTRIRLNRDSAGSGDTVVGGALEPYYYREQPKVEKFDSSWKLDRERSIGTLKNPTDRLKRFAVELRPMLGCVGVAPPANQSFRAGWLGDWGGNMDYNGLREGVTVYLPVNVPGALLFVGDGHAAEGDGELTGDALETSMEVEFRVAVEHNGREGQPRFEDGEYVMIGGIGHSLNDALQRATTGMSRYLASKYKLNPAEIGVVLGTSMRYDVAEVVDPMVHIVAKLPKRVLAQLDAQ
jgi:acetamidase/formamidase